MEFDIFEVEGLSREEVEKIAFETGFCKRKSGKLIIPDFLHSFYLHSLDGFTSYNDIAGIIFNKTDVSLTKQAYQQRMSDECVAFFERILEKIIESKHSSKITNEQVWQDKFNRILVQDSTIIRLPSRLFAEFSGVKNAHATVCNARIQGVYDLISRRFTQFSIDPYSKNDLSAAKDIKIEPKDLVLRDRGYFCTNADLDLAEKKADSIYRFKYGTKIYNTESDKEFNLLNYLRKYNSIDKVVSIGTNEKHLVRIVAEPVTEEVANLRRMKAKKESSHKKPSKELLALMEWTIFITSIKDKEINFDIIFNLYSLRWRIENIFKTWKSNFNFNKIQNVCAKQLKVLLTARLIMITFFNNWLYAPLSKLVKKRTHKQISFMKLMNYIVKNKDIIPKLINLKKLKSNDFDALVRYSTYDLRKRENFEDRLDSILVDLKCLQE